MSIRFSWMCFRFLAIAAGIPFLLWAVITTIRVLLLPRFISDESLWFHSAPFFVEAICFAAYERRKADDFDAISPFLQRDASGQPRPPDPGQGTRRATFQLTWREEAKHDCRINLFYLAIGTPLMFIAVVITASFLPAWGFGNFLICTAIGVLALRLMILLAEKRGVHHGLPPPYSEHAHKNLTPAPPETRGRGLTTQEEAQEFWLKGESRSHT